MCGFAGYFTLGSGEQASEEILQRMSDAIMHRGPDDGGVWIDAGKRLGLSHRRLAIVDLSAAGHQPMTSDAGRYVLVYNGEVYNHQLMRQALLQAGAAPAWRGHSDTETLLAGFEHWGVEETLKRAIGMFALAVFDNSNQTLILARDRLGEKPLYAGWQGNSFLFGSELKALKSHPGFLHRLDRDALVLYFRHNYIPAPYSIYQGISKLAPGSMLELDLATGKQQQKVYWDLTAISAEGINSPNKSPASAVVDELDTLLSDAVGQQMVADVPLGAFLSGGIDSSTIVALMQAQSSRKVRTFSIGFDDPAYNEAQFAKAVAAHLGTEHTEWYLSGRDALDMVPKLASIYDEPFADASQIPTCLVAALAKQQVTVALSGDAGDELFNGYERYDITAQLWQKLQKMPLGARKVAASMIQALPATGLNRMAGLANLVLPGKYQHAQPGDRLHRLADFIAAKDARQLYLQLVSHTVTPEQLVAGADAVPSAVAAAEFDLPGADLRSVLAFIDQHTYLPDDILVKVDRALMSVSLEGRVPMLDHRVVEFAARTPLDLKVRDGKNKWCLRQVLYRYVPAELIERPKKGFAVPVANWLRGPLKPWAEQLLDEKRMQQQGVLNVPLVQQMWREHSLGLRNHAYQLWNILMLQAWLDQNNLSH